MTSRSYSSLTSLVALGACLLTLPYGCYFKDSKSSKGTGNTSATGGSSSTVQPGGGETSGGAGGTSSESASGGTVSASTTLPDISCESDVACKEANLLCDTKIGKCVQCKGNDDCEDGTSCFAGLCGGQAGCTTNDDCADSASGNACDVQRGRCVACVTAKDCSNPDSSECVANKCATITACKNSRDCTAASTPVCSENASPARCVQCNADADCTALKAGDLCTNNKCVTSCESSDDCSDSLKCNTSGSKKFCAKCAENSDCADNQYCNQGECKTDICVADVDQACIDGGIAKCNEAGSGFGTVEACPSGQSCKVNNSRATCGDGGTTTPSGCSKDPGTVDPCTSIPKFEGEQKLDGNSDDFCNIPSFELNFANAAGINNNSKTLPGTPAESFKQRAVAKVAWSPDALHAYLKFIGKPVRSNSSVEKIWDGDSIELMITTKGDGTGTTGNDANALHVIGNNSLAVTVKSTGDTGTHTKIEDTSKVWTGLTDDGFVVELKMPWPNSVTPSSGANVRFELALNVDTESVDPGVTGRDAQAVLAMKTISGTSSCSATPPTPFCDEQLWCPTQLK